MAGKGGKRSTSFQPKWKLGETKAIRVPAVLADQFVDIAREADKEGVVNIRQFLILNAFNKFVESLQGKSGGNQHKKRGEVKTSGERWYFFNKFKNQVESMLLNGKQEDE